MALIDMNTNITLRRVWPQYENYPLNNTGTDFAVVERIMKNKNRNRYKHHVTHALEKYFKDQGLPRSFVDVCKHLRCYLDNSIMEVFYKLDTNETGKVSIQDFKQLCEVLDINIEDGEHLATLKERKANLPERQSRN